MSDEADVSHPALSSTNPPALLRQILHKAPLYAIVDPALRPDLQLLSIVDALLNGGVRLIQYRHKGAFRRKNFDDCSAIADQVSRAGGLFIVNDRADVAALCGAAGVHLGQEDLPPEKARQLLGPGTIIGYSTHTTEQAAIAGRLPVDYIAIGPVYPTNTKQHADPVVGVSKVIEVRSITAKPLVAIGGITLENAQSVLQAGADAVAIASDLIRDSEIEKRVRQFLSTQAAGGQR